MQSTFNLEVILGQYSKYYAEALKTRVYKLPYYEVQEWDKVLDPVALHIFEDIKIIGIPLYPIFPVAENQYLHFANPFNRVGIEIVYKNSDKNIIHRKLELLRSQGWTVYESISTKSHYTFEDFYSYITGKELAFEESEDGEIMEFLEKFKDKNAGCLLQYMKAVHFNSDYYAMFNGF